MQHLVDDYSRALTGVAASTAAVYRRDLLAFVRWAGEVGVSSIDQIDRRVVRRYLAHCDAQGYARRTTARHEVEFHSEREARDAGYRPCKVCRPAVAA